MCSIYPRIILMKHRPVLVREILSRFSNIMDGLIIDATIGKGGHSFEILGNY